MNCFSMIPNYYYNNQIQTPYHMAMPVHRENPVFSSVSLLQTLSLALNKSVRNYQQKLL